MPRHDEWGNDRDPTDRWYLRWHDDHDDEMVKEQLEGLYGIFERFVEKQNTNNAQDLLQGIERHLSRILNNDNPPLKAIAEFVVSVQPVVNGLELIKDTSCRVKVLENIIMQGRKDKENGMAFGDYPSLVAEWMNSIEDDQQRTRLIGKLEPKDLLNFLKQDFTQLDQLQKVENRMPELFSNSAEVDGKNKEWRNNSNKLKRITYAFDKCETIELKADILNHIVGLKDRYDQMVGEGTAIGLSQKFLDSQMVCDQSITQKHMQKMCAKCNGHAAYALLKGAVGNDIHLSTLVKSANPTDIAKAINFENGEFSQKQLEKIAKKLYHTGHLKEVCMKSDVMMSIASQMKDPNILNQIDEIKRPKAIEQVKQGSSQTERERLHSDKENMYSKDHKFIPNKRPSLSKDCTPT